MPPGDCVASGLYADQPVVIPPRKNEESIGASAATISQKLSAFNLGNAISRAPIMIGMMKFPNGPVIMMMVPTIMMIP